MAMAVDFDTLAVSSPVNPVALGSTSGVQTATQAALEPPFLKPFAAFPHFLTGSKAICPSEECVDSDWVYLDENGAMKAMLPEYGWKPLKDASYEMSHTWCIPGIDVILVHTQEEFDKWGLATDVCRSLGLKHRWQRCMVFRAIIAGVYVTVFDKVSKPSFSPEELTYVKDKLTHFQASPLPKPSVLETLDLDADEKGYHSAVQAQAAFVKKVVKGAGPQVPEEEVEF